MIPVPVTIISPIMSMLPIIVTIMPVRPVLSIGWGPVALAVYIHHNRRSWHRRRNGNPRGQRRHHHLPAGVNSGRQGYLAIDGIRACTCICRNNRWKEKTAWYDKSENTAKRTPRVLHGKTSLTFIVQAKREPPSHRMKQGKKRRIVFVWCVILACFHRVVSDILVSHEALSWALLLYPLAFQELFTHPAKQVWPLTETITIALSVKSIRTTGPPVMVLQLVVEYRFLSLTVVNIVVKLWPCVSTSVEGCRRLVNWRNTWRVGTLRHQNLLDPANRAAFQPNLDAVRMGRRPGEYGLHPATG